MTITFIKLQNNFIIVLLTITAKVAQSVQQLSYRQNNLQFNFWQRQGIFSSSNMYKLVLGPPSLLPNG